MDSISFKWSTSYSRALKGVNSDQRHSLETATQELRNGDKRLMSCQNSDNDTGTFWNSYVPSFEIQTEDINNPPYRALIVSVSLTVDGDCIQHSFYC